MATQFHYKFHFRHVFDCQRILADFQCKLVKTNIRIREDETQTPFLAAVGSFLGESVN